MEADFLTVILILYILVIAEKGAILGFCGSVKTTLFLIALFILTITISPKTSDFLGKSQIINSYLDQKAASFVSEKTEEIAAGTNYGFLQNILIPDELEAALQNGDISIIQSEPMQLNLRNAVKGLFIYAVAVVLTMGFSVVILLACMILINKLIKSPEVKLLDRVMGFVLGILEGLLGVWMILALLHLFEFTDVAGSILRSVHSHPLLYVVDENNLVYFAARYVMGLK